MRAEAAKIVAEQPNYAEALCVLGMADAALGNKEDAIREGRRAVELLPVTKDAIVGALLVQYLALIYAWTGEKDLALRTVKRRSKLPGHLSYGQLASASVLGSAARRPALREDRRLARAKVSVASSKTSEWRFTRNTVPVEPAVSAAIPLQSLLVFLRHYISAGYLPLDWLGNCNDYVLARG